MTKHEGCQVEAGKERRISKTTLAKSGKPAAEIAEIKVVSPICPAKKPKHSKANWEKIYRKVYGNLGKREIGQKWCGKHKGREPHGTRPCICTAVDAPVK